MKRARFKIIAFLCMALLLISPAAGCTKANQNDASVNTAASPAPTPAPPLKLTMMCNYNSVEPPKKDMSVIKYFEEKLGVILEVNWVPTTAYNDKLNALIASVDLPHIIAVREAKGSGIINAAKAGMFWELGPHLSKFENLNKLNKNVLKNVSIDGKIYSLPRERELVRAGFMIRKDWLDNVGMQMPTTVNEIYNVLKAFKDKDPDKNGKADTVGYSIKGRNLNTFTTLINIWMGGPNSWFEKDGQLLPDFMSSTYLEAMDFHKRAYEEKLILQDFAVVTDEFQSFNTGKAGLVFLGAIGDAAGSNVADLNKLFPNAVIDVAQDIKTPSGAVKLPAHTGYTGVLMIPRTKVKTEKELQDVLAFIDKTGKPETVDFLKYGVKDTHYTVNNNVVTITKEQNDLYKKDFPDVDQMYPFYMSSKLTVKETPLREKIAGLIAKNSSNVVFNPVEPYISDTAVKLGGELEKIITDARMKYVLGNIDKAGWEKAIEDWKKAGGSAVINEYTTLYKANK